LPDLVMRKFVCAKEEIYHEGGPRIDTPLTRAAVMAVVDNPFACRYEPDIQPLMETLRPLGVELAKKLIECLGGSENVESYGKAALIGVNGELEHGALWHAPGGYAMREVLGGTKAIVPSSKKVGAIGARIDVPLAHINAAYVRSHFDTMEVGLNDAPRANEVIYILAMTTGPRVHSRSGGLEVSNIIGEDGLR